MLHRARDIARTELAGNRDALDSECEPRRQFGENGIGARAAGRAVDNQADTMAALDLALRDIDDMAEQAAERRPQNMDDLEAGRCECGLRVGDSRGIARRPSPSGAGRRTRPNADPGERRSPIARFLKLAGKTLSRIEDHGG